MDGRWQMFFQVFLSYSTAWVSAQPPLRDLPGAWLGSCSSRPAQTPIQSPATSCPTIIAARRTRRTKLDPALPCTPPRPESCRRSPAGTRSYHHLQPIPHLQLSQRSAWCDSLVPGKHRKTGEHVHAGLAEAYIITDKKTEATSEGCLRRSARHSGPLFQPRRPGPVFECPKLHPRVRPRRRHPYREWQGTALLRGQRHALPLPLHQRIERPVLPSSSSIRALRESWDTKPSRISSPAAKPRSP